MAASSDKDVPVEAGSRSVNIGGNVQGAAIVVGDSNTVSVEYTKTELPPADSVDIHQEIAALKELLAQLGSDHGRKIDNAVADAEDELSRESPDKDEIGRALERALGYANKAGALAESAGKLAPHVRNVVGWLGDNWHKLLPLVGLAL